MFVLFVKKNKFLELRSGFQSLLSIPQDKFPGFRNRIPYHDEIKSLVSFSVEKNFDSCRQDVNIVTFKELLSLRAT